MSPDEVVWLSSKAVVQDAQDIRAPTCMTHLQRTQTFSYPSLCPNNRSSAEHSLPTLSLHLSNLFINPPFKYYINTTEYHVLRLWKLRNSDSFRNSSQESKTGAQDNSGGECLPTICKVQALETHLATNTSERTTEKYNFRLQWVPMA